MSTAVYHESRCVIAAIKSRSSQSHRHVTHVCVAHTLYARRRRLLQQAATMLSARLFGGVSSFCGARASAVRGFAAAAGACEWACCERSPGRRGCLRARSGRLASRGHLLPALRAPSLSLQVQALSMMFLSSAAALAGMWRRSRPARWALRCAQQRGGADVPAGRGQRAGNLRLSPPPPPSFCSDSADGLR